LHDIACFFYFRFTPQLRLPSLFLLYCSIRHHVMTMLHHLPKAIRYAALLLAFFVQSSPAFTLAQDLPPRDSSLFKGLAFRNVGPAGGGRVSRACGVPGNPLVYYAATASGGVWKSEDGGIRWRSVFDDQPISSIGAIAVAPSDPNTVYVGSGEANIRGNAAAGNGIYKSTDGGKTWKHVWKQEGQIGTMVVHPTNPDVAFAAVLGHAFGPNKERGVYRTTNGGKTWEQVLAKNAETGASDVCFDPTNPSILFAGLWQARRRPWDMMSGGTGSGLYTSRDGGDTWKQLTATTADGSPSGLPEGIVGKVGVAVAPTNGNRVYALIEHDKGGLFRSDNGGVNWSLVNDSRSLRQRAWYYSTMTIHPQNPDVVWFPQVPMLKTIDGGKTLQAVRGIHHGDHHDAWFDPTNPNRMITANDGGVDISTDGGKSWFAPALPILQFYHVSTDFRTPYYISGAAQDMGTYCGPSNNFAGTIYPSEWYNVGGGEAGHTAHSPVDSNVIFAGEYGGIITRYDHRTRQATNVGVYPTNPSGHGAVDLRYRFQWTAPILYSPHDPNTLYHAANVLFKTTDDGVTWKAISEDLTRNDKSKQQWAGGPITGDNTGVEVYCTIFAVAESPVKQGVIWTGSDDGLVHCTQDGGKTWTNVTKNIPNIPDFGTVVTIEASHFDAGTAYLVVDNHRMDDMKPYLWKTTDYGKTWKPLTTSLPSDVYLHVVREDPKKRGTLYLGTERGVMLSADDGTSWKPLKLNLPTVAVHDIVVKNNDLVLGTHGRGIWVLDDITPIREYTAMPAIAAFNTDVTLLPVPPTYRWLWSGSRRQLGGMQGAPQGMMLHYALKTKAKSVKLDILDTKGVVVRTLSNLPDDKPVSLPGDGGGNGGDNDTLSVLPGLHRASWDLCYKGAEFIKDGKTDGGDPTTGPMALPGVFTLRLTVDGKVDKSVTQTAVVVPDARQILNGAAAASSLQFTLLVRDTISSITRTVLQLRSVKKQLLERNELLADTAKYGQLLAKSKTLLAKLDTLENKLHNPTARVTYDILAGKNNTGSKLYSVLAGIYDFVKSTDSPVAQGMKEVFAEEVKNYERYSTEWQTLRTTDLAAWNNAARAADVPHVMLANK
jgi:photosystem II stability/assembly factor-like uncharacterized protein